MFGAFPTFATRTGAVSAGLEGPSCGSNRDIRSVRCILDSILHHAAAGRTAALLHGTSAGTVPSVRLPDHLEENLPSAERFLKLSPLLASL